MEVTPKHPPYSASRPRAFPPHSQQSCTRFSARMTAAQAPGACLWTAWLDLRMETRVFSNWLFKMICDRCRCVEKLCNTARNNQAPDFYAAGSIQKSRCHLTRGAGGPSAGTSNGSRKNPSKGSRQQAAHACWDSGWLAPQEGIQRLPLLSSFTHPWVSHAGSAQNCGRLITPCRVEYSKLFR